jgi:hypothetical protein
MTMLDVSSLKHAPVAHRSATSRPLNTGQMQPTPVMIGLAIVALVPAVFWTGCLWLAFRAMGIDISAACLFAVGAGIAIFLTAVGSALLARD